jgi:hypothetical protein
VSGCVAVLSTLAAGLAASAGGQAITVKADSAALRVQAPGFTFIEGEVLNQLRDGRGVRLDIELTIFTAPGRSVVVRLERGFNLSFDLWEERFAATRIGTAPQSVSHLTAREAETWCLSHLTVPRAELGHLTADTPFWVRLAYRVPHIVDPNADDADPFTLRHLIDILSRRETADITRSVDAGPFRLNP